MPSINGPDIHDYICDICRVSSLLILLGILIYIILRDIPGIDELVIATYLLGIATLVLGAIALFGPKWAEYNLYAPKLKILFELKPPFCHRTWYGGVTPVYYFRLRVKNYGKSTAKNCEVVLENQWVYYNDKPKKIENFSPVNLKWVPSSEKSPQYDENKTHNDENNPQYIDINPKRGYFCDLGHIPPKQIQDMIDWNLITKADGYPVCQRNGLRFILELSKIFYAQPNYLCPGIRYILEIGLHSGNARFKNAFFEIWFSGKWEDDPDKMFEDNIIYIKEVSDPENPDYI